MFTLIETNPSANVLPRTREAVDVLAKFLPFDVVIALEATRETAWLLINNVGVVIISVAFTKTDKVSCCFAKVGLFVLLEAIRIWSCGKT